MSPILFLITLDNVLRATVGTTKNRDILWGLSEQLVDLDYANDIWLLSSKASDMQYKLNDLVEESAKVGLKLNSAKTKSLKARSSNTGSIHKAGNETVENTDSFTYLASVTDGGAKEDILHRIFKAKGAFDLFATIRLSRLKLS